MCILARAIPRLRRWRGPRGTWWTPSVDCPAGLLSDNIYIYIYISVRIFYSKRLALNNYDFEVYSLDVICPTSAYSVVYDVAL